jgi:hypothetical protein
MFVVTVTGSGSGSGLEFKDSTHRYDLIVYEVFHEPHFYLPFFFSRANVSKHSKMYCI